MPMTEQKTLSGHVGLWTTCDSVAAFWAFIHTEPKCRGAGRSPVVSTLAEDLSGEEGTMAKLVLTFTTPRRLNRRTEEAIRRPMTRWILALVCALGLAQAAGAQDYPTKPVKLMVGDAAGDAFPAGRDADLVARELAKQLSEQLGQQVVVENVSGARSTAATEQAARAAPDGYTLLVADTEKLAINPSLYAGMKIDPSKDLAPIAQVVSTPLLGVVPATSPAKDIKEFLALAQKAPASYNYGSAGVGAVNHLGVELLKAKTGTTFVHTPRWRGRPFPPGQTAVDDNGIVETDVQFMMASGEVVEKLVKEGKLRALVVFNDKRVRSMPNVPTAAEAGLPGDLVVSRWIGLVAPAGTPAAIVERLQKAVETVVATPKFQERLRALGTEPAFLAAADFRPLITSEQRRWSEVVRGTFAITVEDQRAKELDVGGLVLIPKSVKSNFGCAAMGRCTFVLYQNGPVGTHAAPPPSR